MRSMLLAAAALVALSMPAQSAETELTVMSFNIWGGGANENKPVDETVAVIKAVGADIIGVQETRLEGEDCTAESCPPRGESVVPKSRRRWAFTTTSRRR